MECETVLLTSGSEVFATVMVLELGICFHVKLLPSNRIPLKMFLCIWLMFSWPKFQFEGLKSYALYTYTCICILRVILKKSVFLRISGIPALTFASSVLLEGCSSP